MRITSLDFWLFLLFWGCLYYCIPRKIKKYQWLVLLVASLSFFVYASGIRGLAYLTIGVLLAYAFSIWISVIQNETVRKLIYMLGLFSIIAELFFLKYLKFGVMVYNVFGMFSGKRFSYDAISIIAPIGICYYTITIIGYYTEVYWRVFSPEKNPFKLLLFACFFPQMVSGPITRWSDMSEKLFEYHGFDHIKILYGFERIIFGLVKKLVIADRVGIFVATVYENYDIYDGLYIVLGVLMFALELYCDFSGCMDIVVGVGECFGVKLPENFRMPYLTETIAEFWNNWHITMGNWFRDFVFYPMMKSNGIQKLRNRLKLKVSKRTAKNIPTFISLAVLWVVIGIWHGGESKYILACGILPGFYLIMGELLEPLTKSFYERTHINKDRFSSKLFRRIRTLLLMCTTWIFMRSDGIQSGIGMYRSLIRTWNPDILVTGKIFELGLTIKDFAVLAIATVLVLFVELKEYHGNNMREKFRNQSLIFQWLVLLGVIFSILIFGIYGPGYNSTDFIYKNF